MAISKENKKQIKKLTKKKKKYEKKINGLKKSEKVCRAYVFFHLIAFAVLVIVFAFDAKLTDTQWNILGTIFILAMFLDIFIFAINMLQLGFYPLWRGVTMMIALLKLENKYNKFNLVKMGKEIVLTIWAVIIIIIVYAIAFIPFFYWFVYKYCERGITKKFAKKVEEINEQIIKLSA